MHSLPSPDTPSTVFMYGHGFCIIWLPGNPQWCKSNNAINFNHTFCIEKNVQKSLFILNNNFLHPTARNFNETLLFHCLITFKYSISCSYKGVIVIFYLIPFVTKLIHELKFLIDCPTLFIWIIYFIFGKINFKSLNHLHNQNTIKIKHGGTDYTVSTVRLRTWNFYVTITSK